MWAESEQDCHESNRALENRQQYKRSECYRERYLLFFFLKLLLKLNTFRKRKNYFKMMSVPVQCDEGIKWDWPLQKGDGVVNVSKWDSVS